MLCRRLSVKPYSVTCASGSWWPSTVKCSAARWSVPSTSARLALNVGFRPVSSDARVCPSGPQPKPGLPKGPGQLPRRSRLSLSMSFTPCNTHRGKRLRSIGAPNSHISKCRDQRDLGIFTSQQQTLASRPAQLRDPTVRRDCSSSAGESPRSPVLDSTPASRVPAVQRPLEPGASSVRPPQSC